MVKLLTLRVILTRERKKVNLSRGVDHWNWATEVVKFNLDYQSP